MSKKLELTLRVIFSQCIEVEVNDEMEELIEERMFDRIDVQECTNDRARNSLNEFLLDRIDIDSAQDIYVEINDIEELEEEGGSK